MAGRTRSFRHEGRATSLRCSNNLERIRGLDPGCSSQLRRGTQMLTGNICNVDAPTLCEKSFIARGQQVVSGTVGNHQDFEQVQRRWNQLGAAFVHLSEKGLNQGTKQGNYIQCRCRWNSSFGDPLAQNVFMRMGTTHRASSQYR